MKYQQADGWVENMKPPRYHARSSPNEHSRLFERVPFYT